jgi:hypothetical protein
MPKTAVACFTPFVLKIYHDMSHTKIYLTSSSARAPRENFSNIFFLIARSRAILLLSAGKAAVGRNEAIRVSGSLKRENGE